MFSILVRKVRVLVGVAAVGVWLAACGGGEEVVGHDRQAAAVLLPLVDDAGLPMPSAPAAWPRDPGALTQLGLYATPAQADALLSIGSVIEVLLEGTDEAALDLAVMTAYGLQAAKNLPDSSPVLVRGPDLRVAAAVVDRLTSHGYAAVWLVTQ